VNILDFAVIALVALCAIAGYRKGLILTVYRLVSLFIAIFLAHTLYPYVARFLRESALFYGIQSAVKSGMNIGGFVTEYAPEWQREILEGLPLPATLRGLLHTHVEPDFHRILRVDTLEQYVSAFFANIAINGIAILAVFVLVIIILQIIGVALDIVGKLPIIGTLNNFGGLAFGAIMGVGIAWLCIVVLSMFFATNPEIGELVEGSLIVNRVTDSVLPWLAAG
jgi:uncharacterized membrane protein required for colicin V production